MLNLFETVLSGQNGQGAKPVNSVATFDKSDRMSNQLDLK